LIDIEILLRVLFLPTLVSLLEIYSEPSDSILLLYSVLLFEASSYVNYKSRALAFETSGSSHLRLSGLVISLVPFSSFADFVWLECKSRQRRRSGEKAIPLD
jgi:hypothetical protein